MCQTLYCLLSALCNLLELICVRLYSILPSSLLNLLKFFLQSFGIDIFVILCVADPAAVTALLLSFLFHILPTTHIFLVPEILAERQSLDKHCKTLL